MASNWPIKPASADSKPGKRKLPADKKDPAKAYEERRPPRKYVKGWETEFPWLRHSEEKGMTCVSCVESYGNLSIVLQKQKHPFVLGVFNYRKSTVTDHDATDTHQYAQKGYHNRRHPEEAPAKKSTLALHEKNRSDLVLKFLNLYAVVKNNRPFTDYVIYNNLDSMKGLKHDSTYNNRQYATVFLESICKEIVCRITSSISDAPFFSITMDGSTDSSAKEQESIYVRTCVKGKIQCQFLCIDEPTSTCADDLFDFVNVKMEQYGIAKDIAVRLVGFGADGASNMMGNRTGLTTQLKNCYPHLVVVHCLAHRMELAYKDAMKDCNLYMKMQMLMQGIFAFYRKSPKNKKALQETFKVKLIY